MTDHQPMPVAGYTAQSQTAVDLANEGKALEERYLRWLDMLTRNPQINPHRDRYIALARTNIQQGAMWAVRSIFLPERVKLPEDMP